MSTIITRMSRLKRIAAASSILAVTGVVTLAAYSDYAEMEAEFTSGTFGIAIDGDQGGPVPYSVAFDATELNPGDTAETTVELQNTGTITADVTLATTVSVDADSQEFLAGLTGSYSTDGQNWSAEVPLADLATDSELTLQGGDSVPFSIRVHHLGSSANGTQGSKAAVNFRFEAEQGEVNGSPSGPEDPAPADETWTYAMNGTSVTLTTSVAAPGQRFYIMVEGLTMVGGSERRDSAGPARYATADGTGAAKLEVDLSAWSYDGYQISVFDDDTSVKVAEFRTN